MNEQKTLKIIDDFGKKKEYQILIAFKWKKTNKNYIVCLDNANDQNDSLNIFAVIYYPQDDSKLDAIETAEEWNEVEKILKHFQQTDYSKNLKPLRLFTGYYVNNKVTNTYHLHKEYKLQNIKKVNIPFELRIEYSDQNASITTNTKFGEVLKIFAKIMIKNFTREDLMNFCNNIDTLKVSHYSFKLQNFIFRCKIEGAYDVKKNRIIVDESDNTTIYHELLHMSSSFYRAGIEYSGFHQFSLKSGFFNLGEGINEGYTELLRRRYFITENDGFESYAYEIDTADKIEKIVGKEKMESLYLNADLPGLIQELKQFSSEEAIIKFISDVDSVFKYLDEKNFKLFEKGTIINQLKGINKFLIETYSRKLLLQYQQSSINYEQIIIPLSKYISSLISTLRIRKKDYEILSDDDLIESIETIFGKSSSLILIKRKFYF